MFFSSSIYRKAVDNIPGKTGYRLGQDIIDLPCPAVLQHLQHAFPMRQLCTGDTLVRVDPDKVPLGIRLDTLREIIRCSSKDEVCSSLSVETRMYAATFRVRSSTAIVSGAVAGITSSKEGSTPLYLSRMAAFFSFCKATHVTPSVLGYHYRVTPNTILASFGMA